MLEVKDWRLKGDFLYKIVSVRDRVRVPPEKFGEDVRGSIKQAIAEKFEGELASNNLLLLSFVKLENIGEGIIIPGDGAIYYDSLFKMLAYEPMMHEVVQGKITEITEFGAFVNIGPIEGLAHVSQVMDDYVSNPKTGQLQGKQSKKVLIVGDTVIARVIAISLKSTKGAKIGLTMRQPDLGKLEWIEVERAEREGKKKKPKKAKKTKKKKRKR